MRRMLGRANTGKVISILFLQLVILRISSAQPFVTNLSAMSETMYVRKAIPPKVYIIADLPVNSELTIQVEDEKNKEVAKLAATQIRSGRTVTELQWEKVNPWGLIPKGNYTFNISARTVEGDTPIRISHFGIAIGYKTKREASNAVKIITVVPDPVEGEAEINYLLGGLNPLVTIDIFDKKGDHVDNVIKQQKRDPGKNSDIWKRMANVESGGYTVKIETWEKGIARDHRDFTCK